LAGGILVDAVVIRMAVVPSVMLLIGRANWWFPKSLDRVLPHIGLEHADATPAPIGSGDAQPEPAVNGAAVTAGSSSTPARTSPR
jgi:RND superfamily putative drug exporter